MKTKYSNSEVYVNKLYPVLKLVILSENKKSDTIKGMNTDNWKTLNYSSSGLSSYWELTDDVFSRVVFKVCDDGDVVACLIDVPAYNRCVMSYMHVGQHGDAHMDWCKPLKNAKPEQYNALKKELESIGYVLKVTNRFPNNFRGWNTLDN